MNLKENYERFFGKIPETQKEKKTVLNESQKARFTNLSQSMRLKYPNAPLTLKEGYVWMGTKKLEPVEKFLTRSALQINEMVRSFSASGKRGLI